MYCCWKILNCHRYQNWWLYLLNMILELLRSYYLRLFSQILPTITNLCVGNFLMCHEAYDLSVASCLTEIFLSGCLIWHCISVWNKFEWQFNVHMWIVIARHFLNCQFEVVTIATDKKQITCWPTKLFASTSFPSKGRIFDYRFSYMNLAISSTLCLHE